jgi:hypothetical protein
MRQYIISLIIFTVCVTTDELLKNLSWFLCRIAAYNNSNTGRRRKRKGKGKDMTLREDLNHSIGEEKIG